MDFDLWRQRSPHYDETHDALAQSVRTFVAREIEPNIDQWEEDGELPLDLHKKAAETGILGLRYPEEFGGHSEGFDIFHGMVVTEELARPGAGYIRGSKVERIYREVRVNAIGGGSEEIMLDLAGRQLFGGNK